MQNPPGHGAVGMAPQTIGRLRGDQTPARRLDDGVRRRALISNRQIDPARLVVKTDAALVDRPIVLEYVSLAGFALPERIEDRNRKTLRPVRHRDDAAIALPLDLRVVRPLLKLQIGMGLQNFAAVNQQERLRHRRGPKVRRLLSVTGGADGIARSHGNNRREEKRQQGRSHFDIPAGADARLAAFNSSTMARCLFPSCLRFNR